MLHIGVLLPRTAAIRPPPLPASGAREKTIRVDLISPTSGRTGQLAQPALGRRFRWSLYNPSDNFAERLEKLARQLLCGGIDQARAELRQLAADLGIDLVVQDRDVWAFGFKPHRG